MKFFVIWEGDIEKDPLDHGVVSFDDFKHACTFSKTLVNKGLKCTIYKGQKLMEAERY
jgi:hypothetical protein